MTPFTNDRVWYWLGCYPKYESIKFMVSTSKPGFEFSSLKLSGKYYETMNDLSLRVPNVVAVNVKESELFRCFKLLFETKEIQYMLKQGKAKALLRNMISGRDNVEFVQELIDTHDKFDWNLDFTTAYYPEYHENYLSQAITRGQFKIARYFLEKKWFNINQACDIRGMKPILQCIESLSNYDGENVIDCNNFKIFDLLLQQREIDLNVRDRNGNGIVGWIQMKRKYKFIDHLIEKSQEIRKENEKKHRDDDEKDYYENEWKLDEKSIEEELNRYDIADEIISAAKKSDYSKLESLLNTKSIQNIISDVINIVGSRDRTTALMACIKTETGYDKNKPRKNNNFKVFKLLLSQKGIDPLKRVTDNNRGFVIDPALQCLSSKKIEFFKYMVEKFGDSIDKTPLLSGLHNIFQGIIHGPGDEKTFKEMYSMCPPSRMKQYNFNQAFCAVCRSSTDYDKQKQKEGDNWKIFKFILDKKGDEIDINYKQNDAAYTCLMSLVSKNKVEFFKYVLEYCAKHNKKIDYDKHIRQPNGDDLLYMAVEESDDKMVKLLLDLNVFDLNRVENKRPKNNVLLSNVYNCTNYDKLNAKIGGNYKVFVQLLKKYKELKEESGVIEWILEKNNDGISAIEALVLFDKKDYVHHLIESYNIESEYKIDISEIQHKKEVCSKLVSYALLSNFKELDTMLKDIEAKEGKEKVSEYVCSCFGHNSSHLCTPLWASSWTTSGFDFDNQESCSNFACFKLLLSKYNSKYSNLSVGKISTDDTLINVYYKDTTALRECIAFKKHVFMKYLIDYGKKIGHDFKTGKILRSKRIMFLQYINTKKKSVLSKCLYFFK